MPWLAVWVSIVVYLCRELSAPFQCLLRFHNSGDDVAGGQLTILDVFGVNHARFDAQVVAGMLEEEVDLVKGET